MRSEVNKKYFSLLDKHTRLQARLATLEANHVRTVGQLATLYFLLRKVIVLVPYDAPEVAMAHKALDALTSTIDDYVERTHDLAMERAERCQR